jgi:hypothetical protein
MYWYQQIVFHTVRPKFQKLLLFNRTRELENAQHMRSIICSSYIFCLMADDCVLPYIQVSDLRILL